MNNDLNCLQRPKNRHLLEEWDIIRKYVRIQANIHNIDLSKIILVEEVKKD